MIGSHYSANLLAPVLLPLLMACFLASDARGDEVDDWLAKAQAASDRGDSKAAIELLSRAVDARPKDAGLLRWRGRENFRAGQIKPSVADFDRCAELAPDVEKSLWERGISLYYAGEFGRGAKQFELYQTYHDNDVENAVWRYLCVARGEGVEKAKSTLLPIKNDRRVPMMEIYDLYRGKLSPEAVLDAARRGEPSEAALRQQLFYAHLYIGLFHEAAGERAKAAEHIKLAGEKYRIGHYMGDVARVHAGLLE